MVNEQPAADGPASAQAPASEQQALVVSTKAQQPNGETGGQIVVSSEAKTGELQA